MEIERERERERERAGRGNASGGRESANADRSGVAKGAASPSSLDHPSSVRLGDIHIVDSTLQRHAYQRLWSATAFSVMCTASNGRSSAMSCQLGHTLGPLGWGTGAGTPRRGARSPRASR